jgi:hypothetical protein
VVVNFNEVVDDDSPMAHTLTDFQRIVARVAEVEGPGWDQQR